VFATIERKRGRDGVLRPTGRPLNPSMVTRVFRKYAAQAGLPTTIRLHDLRHTAITSAINEGEDILLIAAFAGHAKTSTTTDVYGHMLSKRVGEAARRMRSPSHRTAHTPTANVEDLHPAEAQPTTENPGNVGDRAS
jgi:integrase